MIKRLLLFLGMMSCVLTIAGCSAQKKPGETDSDKRAENAADNVSPEPEQTPQPEAATTAPPVEPEQTSPPENIFDRIPTEGNVWKINEIEREYGLRAHSSPDGWYRNFHKMTREDVLDYFGMELDLADFLPELHENPDAEYGFYESQFAGSNTVIEQCHFYYHGDETYPGYSDAWTQEIMVVFKEGSLPDFSSVDYNLSQELRNNWEPEVSVVQGQEVRIVQVTVKWEEEVVFGQYYFADFLINDLGVTIEALGMEEEDIKKVIEYLVFYALEREGG